MKKKKIGALLLAAAMTAGSLLAGCGSSGSADGGDSAGTSGSDAGSSSGGDTLTVMCVGTEADAYIDDYNAIAEEFSKDNEYGVNVKIDFYENEQYKTKLTTLMASNAVPDIFFTWELSYLQPFVEGGKVADITSYLEEDAEWKNSFADGTLDLLMYDGKNYGVPTQKSLCVMFYNKKIFEENQVSVPETYDEFLSLCQTLKDNGVTPMTLCGTDAWIPAQFVQQIAGGMAGDKLFQDICDGNEKWNNQTHIKAAEELKNMADKGYFQNGYIGMGPEESTEVFTTGKAAMYFQGAWDASKIAESDVSEDTGVFVLPPYDSQYANISVGSVDTNFSVSESCPNKDAAVAFLKYWTSQEREEKLLYEVGRIPAGNFEIDETKLSPLMSEVIAASNAQVGLCPWWDRQFGAGEGVEFNNTCVSVLGGEDAAEAFDALQQFAEDNASR